MNNNALNECQLRQSKMFCVTISKSQDHRLIGNLVLLSVKRELDGTRRRRRNFEINKLIEQVDLWEHKDLGGWVTHGGWTIYEMLKSLQNGNRRKQEEGVEGDES